MVRWGTSVASAIGLMMPAISAAQTGMPNDYRYQEPEITPPARKRH